MQVLFEISLLLDFESTKVIYYFFYIYTESL